MFELVFRPRVWRHLVLILEINSRIWKQAIMLDVVELQFGGLEVIFRVYKNW